MFKTATAVALAMSAALLAARPAAADDVGDDLTDLVEILHERGVLDEGEHQALTAKAAQADKKKHWTDRFELWGDFRARYEGFWYFDDPVNGALSGVDRNRLRYRVRLNLKADVNDYADLFVQLTTGDRVRNRALGADGRSTNDTLGNTIDWDPNGIFIRQAYMRASPFRGGHLPDDNGKLWFYYGRTKQPWRYDWIHKDWFWDDEMMPAGFYGDTRYEVAEGLELYGNGGIFIIQENGVTQDPALSNVQTGFDAKLFENIDFGGQFTWFIFWDLDQSFLDRGVALGNTPSGFTGDPNGGRANVLEFGGYVTLKFIDRWPIKLYGNFARNVDASPVGSGITRTGSDGTGWLAGVDIGDKNEIVQLGMLFAQFEANVFPAQFVDSDIFDGFTNREGFVWYASKTVMENTTASMTAFLSDELNARPGYDALTLVGSERFRLQANLEWKF